VFIKGNLDPVNVLWRGSVDQVRDAAIATVLAGKPGGGYVLSSACSVAPRVPPENIAVLAEVAEQYGRYP
jgi:uroporphyrinogen-III decarboxylase